MISLPGSPRELVYCFSFLSCVVSNATSPRSNRMRLGSQFLVQHLGISFFLFRWFSLHSILKKTTTASSSRKMLGEKHVKCNCIFFLSSFSASNNERWLCVEFKATTSFLVPRSLYDSIMLLLGFFFWQSAEKIGRKRFDGEMKSLRCRELQSNFPLQCPPENCFTTVNKRTSGFVFLLPRCFCFRLNEFLAQGKASFCVS